MEFTDQDGQDFVLDPLNLEALNRCLRGLGWLTRDGVMRAERIGAGNMNFTVRIWMDHGSFVLKQARPWVVKYPQIAAPIERATVEAAFYRVTAGVAGVSSQMPQLLGFSEAAHLLWLEDLGEASDFMDCYEGENPGVEACRNLTEFLVSLHGFELPESAKHPLQNRAMRALNHQHQYDLPLRPENGYGDVAGALREDRQYCQRIAALGKRYLSDGDVLLHGDYFPGSWLRAKGGIAVIDPEFCYPGDAEYDVGVFLAHLEFLHARELWSVVETCYSRPLDWALARRYAGAELMRRLIGVAQLPLRADLDQKQQWLKFSRELVCA